MNGPTRARIGVKTLRTDRWWLYPAVTFVVFSAFVVYATCAGLPGRLLLRLAVPLAVLLALPRRLRRGGLGLRAAVRWLSRSRPALIILIFPLGFRMTCYYYRKAYYRAFWLSPPACAVAEPHGKYTGETRFPLILQNIHRWFWYAAVLIACILTFDTVLAFRNEDHEWGHMGLGTVLMIINVVLIWLYTLSCHSCRHITGGRLRHFSKHPVRYRLWTWVSRLNDRPRQVRVVLAVLDRGRRPLHLPARHRCLRRPEVLLDDRETGTR